VAGPAVPTLDVNASCKAAARRAKPVGDLRSCLRAEHQARRQLERDWASFRDADKTACGKQSTAGGLPTYTELITCLEMVRDARKLDVQPSTTGIAPSTERRPQ
jgi:hypothetical protein